MGSVFNYKKEKAPLDEALTSMAPGMRFERTTCPLGEDCSIQLSYPGIFSGMKN